MASLFKLTNSNADVFAPDGMAFPDALSRTTHLGICAHQDDLEFMAVHGILACFGRRDKWFSGVVVTDGAGSSRTGIYASYSDAEMAAVRPGEQRKAACVGDYAAMLQLGYTSAQAKNPGVTSVSDDIHAILKIARPEVVYLHNPADKHDTHIASFLRALDALRRLPPEDRPGKVYGCEVWRGLDWLCDSDKQVHDVSAFANLQAALNGVFDSQITGGKRYDLAVIGRRMANATFFDSHSSDKATHLQWAMDLTPLVQDETLDVTEYTLDFVQRLAGDIKARLAKLS
ncbi:MAG: PIG-L family deacetylase [Puniceicoccales bacterium]|jgi:LmbE family N-acetylglucosaminyl deacetylase|nr:PIG-L family deacetylase [Puniceicoccales bacterium]